MAYQSKYKGKEVEDILDNALLKTKQHLTEAEKQHVKENLGIDRFVTKDELDRLLSESPFEFVDLGLPSGTLWATCNIGAANPEEAGLYFAWGEIEGYKVSYTADGNIITSTTITDKDGNATDKKFSAEHYKWIDKETDKLTKYNTNPNDGVVDNLTKLVLVDDAAYALDRSSRMPSVADFEELIENSTFSKVAVGGQGCGKFTSKKNGNSIIFPAVGRVNVQGISGFNAWAVYPTREIKGSIPSDCNIMYFTTSYSPRIDSAGRVVGMPIRAIKNKLYGNDDYYYTKEETNVKLEEKQNTILDLESIREGASLGSTAIQMQDLSDYATKKELEDAVKAIHIDDLTKQISGKASRIGVKDMNVFLFATEEDKRKWLEDGSETWIDSEDLQLVEKVIQITNVSGNNNPFFTTAQDTAVVTVSWKSLYKSIASSEYSEMFEDAVFTARLRREGSTEWVTIDEGSTIANGKNYLVDIKKYLAIGSNQLIVEARGATSKAEGQLLVTATLTSLSLSCNHPWHKAWIQGQEFAITNIFFTGNVAKTLYIKVGNETYTKEYSASTSYDKVPTSFDLTNHTPPQSGVIPIEMWLVGGIETEHIHYNIMYVASEDVGKVSLICTNNVKPVAYNFTEEQLLEYAVYGISNLTTSVVAHINKDTVDVLPAITQNVIAQTVYQLKLSLQIDTVETEGISLEVNLSSGDTSVIETIDVDNSKAYLATEGFKFYLNTSLGNNDSVDRETIKNSATVKDGNYKESYNAVWSNYTFADDAWGKDTDGNRALVAKAGSELVVTDLKPLQYSNSKSATFEFMFRASNIADYETPIITCIDTEEYTQDSVGLVVLPTKVLLLGTAVRQELFQQLPLSEDRIHHIGVVIQRGYAGSTLNIARIFVDGCENVTFQFSGGNLFYNASGVNALRIGQQSTDTYLYMARIYDIALEPKQMLLNYLNAMIETFETSREGLRDDNSIVDGTSLSYDLCKKAGFNCLVLEIEGDKAIPSLSNPVEYSSGCNWHFEYNDHPEWNVSLYNAPMDGQGTTSSLYSKWNLRSKNKKEIRWVYHNLKDAQGNVLVEIGKDGYLAGYGLNPKVSRITCKKNIASQPQGHKMGATMMYNDIYKRVMGGAEKLVADNILPTTGARVAVYQHPFMGFQKFSDGHYEFIGLYTGGPDKGDKKTFGYNETDKFPSLMMIEGPNHDPYLTRFLVPWTDDVFYDYQAETLSVGAEFAADGAKQEGWDADIVADYSSDEAEDAQSILNLYKTEFKPAYDAIYYNSPYIASITESGKTLAEINANVVVFQKEKTREYANSLMTFYDDQYRLIYYRVKTGKYEVLDKSVHNMLTYLGLSGNPTTEQIIAARDAKWLSEVGKSVNMREAYYRQIFDEFIGASDNDAKNSYWRKFLALALGGKWGFNEDDLDTIFQNDNNGQDTKDYFVEPDDTSASGADIFQGRTSAFWFALRRNCKEQLRGMMKEVVDAMYAEAESKGLLDSTVHQTVFNLIDYYFWRHSSKYFPATAYNQDTQFAYIDVWYQAPDAVYNNVPPLTQIHGDHYETEREWVSKRIPYMFSKYQIAAFEAGAADGYGSLEFTPAEGYTMDVVPAIDLYPRVSYGGSTTQNSQRTKAGDVCPLVLSASGTTGNYIKAMDWLSDLGDLSNLRLSARSASEAAISFSVKGKRLRRLKVGDKDKSASEIKFNASSIGVESEALEVLDARNVSTIEGSISLQKCPRLREAYFGGTDLKSVIPPTGGRLEKLQMPESVQDLILYSLNLLKLDNLEIPESALANIRNLYINSCKNIDAVELLQRIYNTPNNKLTALGVIWKDTIVDTDGSAFNMFATIAKKAGADGGYAGVDFVEDITPMTMPNISGSLDAQGMKGVYQEDIDNILTKLPNLLLTYDPSKIYIKFQDPEVLRVLLANGVGDGVGILESQADSVKDIKRWFENNTEVETFDELGKFENVTSLYYSFRGCTNLKSIDISNIIYADSAAFNKCSSLSGELYAPNLKNVGTGTFQNCTMLEKIDLSKVTGIGGGAFASCSALKTVVSLENLTSIGDSCFDSCTQLSDAINVSNLRTIGSYVFQKSGITSFNAPLIESIDLSCFNGCASLKTVSIPNIKTISANGFYQCISLERLDAPNVTRLGENSFRGCSSLVYINTPNLETVSWNVFYSCSSLTGDYDFPKVSSFIGGFMTNTSITSIKANNAISISGDFANCKKLKSATFENVQSVGSFSNDSSLEEVYMPNVVSLSRDCFQGCSSLTELNLPKLGSIGTGCFRACSSLQTISIPKLTTITSQAFYQCKELVTVESDSLEVVDNQEAFYLCSKLKNINLSKVKSLGTCAFQYCVALEQAVLPLCEAINSKCFDGCSSLALVDVGDKISSIGTYAFGSISKTATIIIRATTPPTLSNVNAFASTTVPIYVPDSAVEAYKTASVWSEIASRIVPLSEYIEQ